MNSGIPAPPPDLTSILQTLSAYAPPRSLPASVSKVSDLEEGEYEPSESTSATTTYHAPKIIGNVPAASPDHHTKKAAPIVASVITTWPRALNFAVKNIFPDSQKKRRIQNLIVTQHNHERQWWSARQELVKKAENRGQSRKELDSVLASIGGHVAASNANETMNDVEEETAKELRLFDRKVHKACQEMVNAAEKELSDLGVPFFVAGSGDSMEKEELTKLRRKMIQMLEDYCGSQDDDDE